MLFPVLGTLIVDGVLWAPEDPKARGQHLTKTKEAPGIPTELNEVRERLAHALEKRGGLQQLIIRRGRDIEKFDVVCIGREGNVANLSWDGLTLRA